MTGTAWTEPRQGATAQELYDALKRYPEFSADEKEARITRYDGTAHDRAKGNVGSRMRWSERTNLRLTGSPLTADDLKRIEQAEVTR